MKKTLSFITFSVVVLVLFLSCQMGTGFKTDSKGSLYTSFRAVDASWDNDWKEAGFTAAASVTLTNIKDKTDVHSQSVTVPESVYFDDLKMGATYEISVEVSGNSEDLEISNFKMGKGTTSATVTPNPHFVNVPIKYTSFDSVKNAFYSLLAGETKTITLKSDLFWDEQLLFDDQKHDEDGNTSDLSHDKSKIILDLNGYTIYNRLSGKSYMIKMKNPGENAGFVLKNGTVKGLESDGSLLESGVICSTNTVSENNYIDIDSVKFENIGISVLYCKGGNKVIKDNQETELFDTENVHLTLKNSSFISCGRDDNYGQEPDTGSPMNNDICAAVMLGTSGTVVMENVGFKNCVYQGAGAVYFDNAKAVFDKVSIENCKGYESAVWEGKESTAILTNGTEIVSNEGSRSVYVGKNSIFVMAGASIIDKATPMGDKDSAVYLGGANATLAMVDRMETKSVSGNNTVVYSAGSEGSKVSVKNKKYSVFAKAESDVSTKIALAGKPVIEGIVYLGAFGDLKSTINKVGEWKNGMKCSVEPESTMVFQLKEDLETAEGSGEFYKVGGFDILDVTYQDASSYFEVYSSDGELLSWSEEFVENPTTTHVQVQK